MSDTATKILDVGQELIQTRGYTAMSFQDIATQVGIKKPSVIATMANGTSGCANWLSNPGSNPDRRSSMICNSGLNHKTCWAPKGNSVATKKMPDIQKNGRKTMGTSLCAVSE